MAWICPSLRGLVAEGHRAGYIPDGDCPGGLSPLAKPVAAVAGDTIEIDRSGVRVNGRLLPRSRRFARDGEGRTIASVPAGRYTVGAGEVWFVSSYNPASYDSRYFGPLRVGDVRGQIRPVWVRG